MLGKNARQRGGLSKNRKEGPSQGKEGCSKDSSESEARGKKVELSNLPETAENGEIKGF